MCKNSMVYRVRFHNTEYLLKYNPAPDLCSWGYYQENAQLFTYKQAHKIAMRFNKGIDTGAFKPYGYCVKS